MSSNSVVHQRLAPPNNTYESNRGDLVVMEFADPTSASAQGNPQRTLMPVGTREMPPTLSRAATWQGIMQMNGSGRRSPEAPVLARTRLEATFEAIKKMSAGLASPRLDYGRVGEGSDSESGMDGKSYFNVVAEGEGA
jgi:hypothetical protein